MSVDINAAIAEIAAEVSDEDIESIPSHTVAVYVPGKQITLAHIIAKPSPVIYEKLGLDYEGTDFSRWSIGIMKFTPWEAALISSNIALQSADVELGFVDRFMGTLVITGSITAVTSAVKSVAAYCRDTLNFHVARITKN